jgi:hypothetical protein
LISSSLILTVLVGGTIYLLRYRDKKAAPVEEPAPKPAPETIKPKEPDADIMSWEAELALKISRLEEAFQQLSRRLSTAESSAERKKKVEVLTKRQANRGELLPVVQELYRRGNSPAAIAKQLKLSDEQVALLLNFTLSSSQERTVGE